MAKAVASVKAHNLIPRLPYELYLGKEGTREFATNSLATKLFSGSIDGSEASLDVDMKDPTDLAKTATSAGTLSGPLPPVLPILPTAPRP